MTVALERYTSVEAIADEWDELADSVGASPFVRPRWIGLWWEAFGAGRLEVLAFRRDGRLAGVLPVGHRAGGVRATANWHSPEWGVTAADGEAARALFDAVFESRPAYADLRFFGPGLAEAEAAARTIGYRTRTRVIQRSPYIPLAGGWESLRRPREKELVRSRRKLGKDHGEVSLELHDGTSRLDEVMEEALIAEASGWKLEKGTAIVSHEHTRRFYEGFIRWAASRGTLRLFILRAGDRVAAAEIGAEDCGRFYFLKGGIDPELRKYSPGMLIAFEVIQWAADHGLESFEYLGAPEPAKLAWTDEARELTALEAFSRKPLGRLADAAYTHGRPLAARLRR